MTLRTDEQGFWTPDGAHIPWHALRVITPTVRRSFSLKVELAGETRNVRVRGDALAEEALREAWYEAQLATLRRRGGVQVCVRPFEPARLWVAIFAAVVGFVIGPRWTVGLACVDVRGVLGGLPASDAPGFWFVYAVLWLVGVLLVWMGPALVWGALRERREISAWRRAELRREGVVRVAPDGTVTMTPWDRVSRVRTGWRVGAATLPWASITGSALPLEILVAKVPREPSRWKRRVLGWTLVAAGAALAVAGVGLGWEGAAGLFAMAVSPGVFGLLAGATSPRLHEEARGRRARLAERTGWSEVEA